MKSALVEIDLQILRDLLCLPETCRIVRAQTADEGIHLVPSGKLTLVVEDPSFEDLEPGCELPRKSFSVKRHRTPAEFVGWA